MLFADTIGIKKGLIPSRNQALIRVSCWSLHYVNGIEFPLYAAITTGVIVFLKLLAHHEP